MAVNKGQQGPHTKRISIQIDLGMQVMTCYRPFLTFCIIIKAWKRYILQNANFINMLLVMDLSQRDDLKMLAHIIGSELK